MPPANSATSVFSSLTGPSRISTTGAEGVVIAAAAPDPDQDFRHAIRARYLRALAGPRQLAVLATGLLLNLLFRNVLFDWLSSLFRWYENMTLIVAGLSVDFYLLCLVTLTHHTFDSYRQARIFTDLRTAGVRAWSVFLPLLQVLAILIIADPIIEGLIGLFTGHEPFGLSAVGYLISLLYAPIAALLIGTLILVMNLKRWPLLIQYFVTLGLTFGSLLLMTIGGDLLEPHYRQWNPETSNSGKLQAIASLAGGSWNNFANLYAYYTMLIVEGFVLAALLLPLYFYARRLAERKFPQL